MKDDSFVDLDLNGFRKIKTIFDGKERTFEIPPQYRYIVEVFDGDKIKVCRSFSQHGVPIDVIEIEVM